MPLDAGQILDATVVPVANEVGVIAYVERVFIPLSIISFWGKRGKKSRYCCLAYYLGLMIWVMLRSPFIGFCRRFI